jgi:putative tricarboxylic transport membrane protein
MAGRLRGIAVTSDKRLGGDFAQVPTWKELGVNAYYASWRCLVGPKGMSADQVAFWEQTIARMSESDEWKTALANFVQEPAFQGSADLRRFLDAQAAEMKSTLVGLGMAK